MGLSIQERQCGANGDWCRYVAALLSFGQEVLRWVVSAVVIVRVCRGVEMGRWKFDRRAVIHDGELKIRVASLKPGTILALEVTVEAIVRPWKYVPLRLTNGNSLSLMADVAMHMRHTIDADSPFASPTWRDEVRGVSITIKGYDTVSCDEVAANHFYYTQDGGIVEGRRFSDANTRASMANLEYGLQGKKQRLTSIFDYDRLDELV